MKESQELYICPDTKGCIIKDCECRKPHKRLNGNSSLCVSANKVIKFIPAEKEQEKSCSSCALNNDDCLDCTPNLEHWQPIEQPEPDLEEQRKILSDFKEWWFTQTDGESVSFQDSDIEEYLKQK